MRRRITNTIHADYMKCPYKAYLKMNGETGHKTDFEKMQNEILAEYKVSSFHFLRDRWNKEQIGVPPQTCTNHIGVIRVF